MPFSEKKQPFIFFKEHLQSYAPGYLRPSSIFRPLPPTRNSNSMEGRLTETVQEEGQPKRYKTRIAPTPSGFLHLGNVFSFALTALLAERYRARIVLRIDDMDRQRVRPEYIQDIFDTLNFLELPWHEGPRDAASFAHEYSQRHRMPLYDQALSQLRGSGKVFACDCSRNDILKQNASGHYTGTCLARDMDPDQPGLSWRLDTRNGQPLVLNTMQGTAVVTLPGDQQYFVLRKKDGDPAYQLSSLVDDRYFGINLVIRGQDLYASTIAQLYLARELGNDAFQHSLFHHHPLLVQPDGSKLSKSEGATSVRYLRRDGKPASAIFSLIANQLGIPGTVKDWRGLSILLPV